MKRLFEIVFIYSMSKILTVIRRKVREFCFNERMQFKGDFLAKEKTDNFPTDSVLPLLEQGHRYLDNISLKIVPEFDYRH